MLASVADRVPSHVVRRPWGDVCRADRRVAGNLRWAGPRRWFARHATGHRLASGSRSAPYARLAGGDIHIMWTADVDCVPPVGKLCGWCGWSRPRWGSAASLE